MAEQPTDRGLYLIRSDEPSVSDEFRPVPSWTDVALVLAVCVPFWAGLTWLVATWV